MTDGFSIRHTVLGNFLYFQLDFEKLLQFSSDFLNAKNFEIHLFEPDDKIYR